MWVTTDGQDDSAGVADSAYVTDLSGSRRGVPRLVYNAPEGAEVCGPCFTPDGTTLFLAIQHPGEERGKSSFDTPNTRWPDFKEGVPPRPSVVAITREDGRPV
jgi:secreted PhoX family phosphatase